MKEKNSCGKQPAEIIPAVSSMRRIYQNTGLLYIRQLVTLVVGLLTTRIVLQCLGVENYGIYNVVGGVIVLFSFLGSTITAATQRYLSFYLGKGDCDQAREYFSISLLLQMGCALIVSLLGITIGAWVVNYVLDIPESRGTAALIVYGTTIAMFAIRLIRSPFEALVIAHEKMSFFAYFSIIEALLRLGAVAVLTQLSGDLLIAYGFLCLIASFVSLLLCVVYCRHSFTDFRFVPTWNRSKYSEFISFFGWNVFGSIAHICKDQGSSIMINVLFGVTHNAAMGIARRLSGVLNSFVVQFQFAARPRIVKTYSNGDSTRLITLVADVSRLSFCLMFLLVFPAFLNVEALLTLWLSEPPKYAAPFCRAMLIFNLVECLSGPLWAAIQATGKIRNYQIVASALLMLNLPISYFFLVHGAPAQTLYVVATAISIILMFARLLFLKQLIGLKIVTFFRAVFIRILFIILVSGFSLYLFGWLGGSSGVSSGKWAFILPAVLQFVLAFVIVVTFGSTAKERSFARKQLSTLIPTFRGSIG